MQVLGNARAPTAIDTNRTVLCFVFFVCSGSPFIPPTQQRARTSLLERPAPTAFRAVSLDMTPCVPTSSADANLTQICTRSQAPWDHSNTPLLSPRRRGDSGHWERRLAATIKPPSQVCACNVCLVSQLLFLTISTHEANLKTQLTQSQNRKGI